MPGPAKHVRSPIVGDIRLAPPGAEPPGEALASREQQQIPMLIELNALFPGGLATARDRFFGLWDRYQHAAGGSWPEGAAAGGLLPVPPGLAFVAPGLYQCVLSRATAQDMVNEDLRSARASAQPPIIFKVYGRTTPFIRRSTGPHPRSRPTPPGAPTTPAAATSCGRSSTAGSTPATRTFPPSNWPRRPAGCRCRKG